MQLKIENFILNTYGRYSYIPESDTYFVIRVYQNDSSLHSYLYKKYSKMIVIKKEEFKDYIVLMEGEYPKVRKIKKNVTNQKKRRLTCFL
jgi:hypothetical protein